MLRQKKKNSEMVDGEMWPTDSLLRQPEVNLSWAANLHWNLNELIKGNQYSILTHVTHMFRLFAVS